MWFKKRLKISWRVIFIIQSNPENFLIRPYYYCTNFKALNRSKCSPDSPSLCSFSCEADSSARLRYFGTIPLYEADRNAEVVYIKNDQKFELMCNLSKKLKMDPIGIVQFITQISWTLVNSQAPDQKSNPQAPDRTYTSVVYIVKDHQMSHLSEVDFKLSEGYSP